jgi:hypothetical protein
MSGMTRAMLFPVLVGLATGRFDFTLEAGEHAW